MLHCSAFRDTATFGARVDSLAVVRGFGRMMMGFVVAAQKFVDQAGHDYRGEDTRTVRQCVSATGTKVTYLQLCLF